MKNSRLQFWRIVFTYVIAYYHLNNVYDRYTSGYIAVEFFFMLSGFLLAKKYFSLKEDSGENGISAAAYTRQRYVRFFPHCFFSFLVAFAINGIYRGFAAADYLKGFVSHIPEVLLVHAAGLDYDASFLYNSVSWYLSALLILGYFIWLALRKLGKTYIELLCPLSVLFIYPYLFRTYGQLGEHRETIGFFLNTALLRGLADINLGMIAYLLSQKIGSCKKRSIAFLSDLCLIAGGLVLPCFVYRTSYDFLFAFLLFAGIVCAASCDPSLNRIFDNVWLDRWAMITLAIYLNHKIFRNAFKLFLPEGGISAYILWFVFITLYSVLSFMLIYRFIPKIFSLWRKKKAG
ncbi:MAG: acyltransferase [Lachnospiraceae bacterium]|nr:acyltransferase [Lachnospiraceae bacterium]